MRAEVLQDDSDVWRTTCCVFSAKPFGDEDAWANALNDLFETHWDQCIIPDAVALHWTILRMRMFANMEEGSEMSDACNRIAEACEAFLNDYMRDPSEKEGSCNSTERPNCD